MFSLHLTNKIECSLQQQSAKRSQCEEKGIFEISLRRNHQERPLTGSLALREKQQQQKEQTTRTANQSVARIIDRAQATAAMGTKLTAPVTFHF